MLNVNLITERERARHVGEAAGRLAFFIAVAAFIAAMTSFTWQQTRLRALRASIAAAQSTVSKLGEQKNDIDAVQRQLDSQRPLVDLLRSARDSEAKWCQALADIAQALPDGVKLNSARSSKTLHPRIMQEGSKSGQATDREGFTLVGQAATGNLVAQFYANLQNTTSFKTKEVYLQYTRRRGGGPIPESIDFEIQAFLPGKGAPR